MRVVKRLGEWSEVQLLILECTVVDRIGALNGTSARRCRRLCSGAAPPPSPPNARRSQVGRTKGEDIRLGAVGSCWIVGWYCQKGEVNLHSSQSTDEKFAIDDNQLKWHKIAKAFPLSMCLVETQQRTGVSAYATVSIFSPGLLLVMSH